MAGWNLLVAGGTSAGKTTLLNTLSGAIPAAERVVTIEETAELRLAQPHVVRLEARPPNAEGAGGVGVRALVRAALRMRPDRVVVGEVRGVEALDMLQALNTGHDGSMSTIHANGAADALSRLETLVLLADAGLPLVAVRAQVIASVDAVVFVARRPGGIRRVEAIAEVVDGDERVRLLFAWEAGELRPVSPPRRPARRPDAAPVDPRWVRCLRSSWRSRHRSRACCSFGRHDARSRVRVCGGSPRARTGDSHRVSECRWHAGCTTPISLPIPRRQSGCGSSPRSRSPRSRPR
jgi:energy-coupling factor transporter ATP-binding protein EcfA2